MKPNFLTPAQLDILAQIAGESSSGVIEKVRSKGTYGLTSDARDTLLGKLAHAVASSMTSTGETTKLTYEVEELIDIINRPNVEPAKIIYLHLEDEGSDAWRPVKALHLDGDNYEILSEKLDPDEVWEFATGEVVRCVPKFLRDSESKKCLVAIEKGRSVEKTVSELWSIHMQQKFPKGFGGEEIDGIDLVLLGSETAGYVQTAIGSRGMLDPSHLVDLSHCLADLRSVNSRLSGDAKSYFERLEDMAHLVLVQNGWKG